MCTTNPFLNISFIANSIMNQINAHYAQQNNVRVLELSNRDRICIHYY
jgi:hypothetical protein